MRITLRENGLILDILVTSDGDVRLLNLSPKELPDPEDSRWFRLLELQLSGQNQDDNCGSKHTGTQPGSLLRYAGVPETVCGGWWPKLRTAETTSASRPRMTRLPLRDFGALRMYSPCSSIE